MQRSHGEVVLASGDFECRDVTKRMTAEADMNRMIIKSVDATHMYGDEEEPVDKPYERTDERPQEGWRELILLIADGFVPSQHNPQRTL